jgi:hypothetical protein
MISRMPDLGRFRAILAAGLMPEGYSAIRRLLGTPTTSTDGW